MFLGEHSPRTHPFPTNNFSRKKMNSKILILTFVACYQVATAQIPTGLPNPLSTGMTPPFFGNNNWMRPLYTAAAEGWRTYFEQLNQARNQLFQTLNTFQPQNVDLKPPVVEVPAQHQVAPSVVRPQSQNDAQVPRPQGSVNVGHASQGQAGGRQPAVAIPNVTSGTRPIASTGASSVIPQVGPQIVPQVPNWVGK